MKIRIGCIFLTVVLILGLVGCGSVGDKQMSNESVSEEQKVIVPTGIMVPVAEHEEVIFPINDFNISYVFLGDTFVYMEREWDREAGMNICTLSRVAADGMSEPEQFYQNTTEQPSIWCFTMDDHENIYTLDWLPVSSNRQWFLHKSDKNMQELASVILDESVFPAGRLNSVDDIVVDSYGNVALLDYQNSWIYFFDKDLNFTGKDDVSLIFIEGRFVNAGEQGAFLWDSDIMTQNITLQKLNFEEGCLEDPEYFNIGEYFSDMEMYCLLSGGDKGILMSGQDTLWQYLPATGEVAELLDWKDANVNIDGYGAETIIFEQEEAGECLTVLCNDTVNDISEISKITYKDSAYVPQRTIITMGLSGNRMAEDWVNRFNRSNDKYTIEIKMYDDLFGLAEDLLYNPEEVPDLMDITWVDADMLNSKGLLEDLTPYFEKSELVKKEDILEQIWDMCSYEGKLTSIMCYFDFGSCTTIVEDIPENGWTYDEFLALDKKYPDSRQLLFNLPYSVWSFLDRSGANTFVDWDKKECNYDSEEFRSLLTQLKDVKTNSKDITSWSSEDEINWMLSGEYLIREIRYRSPYDYLSMEGEYEGKIKDVGYPTIDGTPCYLIEPSMYFSIYSESENKDGAWAFIEFMLTEEEQTWYGVSFYGFPVRKENFESYLTRKYSQIYSSKYNPTEETAEIFRNMLEHSQMVKGRGTGEVRTIVWEELEAFHAGAKTAEETAEIIKNRVQLYLDENF